MIRAATADDRPLFLELWDEFLAENAKSGAPMLPTVASLAFVRAIFDQYVSGAKVGVVLLAGANGGLMWGEPMAPLGFDAIYGDFPAFGWGTYVRPVARGLGLATALHKEGLIRLRERGFSGLVGGYHVNNAAGRALLVTDGGYAVETSMFVPLNGTYEAGEHP